MTEATKGDPHNQLLAAQLTLLEERARLLATNDDTTTADTDAAQRGEPYLCLRVVDERYGLELAAVHEVIPLTNLVALPGAPPHLAGLTRLRGRMWALIDLRRFWEPGSVGHADSDQAILVEVEGVEFGLICTDVEGLLQLPASAISPVPSNTPQTRAACLLGLGQRDVQLLDLVALLRRTGFRVGEREEG